MAWQDEMDEILRVMVNDTDGTIYTDLSLERTLAVAAMQLSQELDFVSDFKGKPDSVAPDIIPDPTDDATRDESFMNLACLKAACILDHASAIQAANQAIYVKDGSSAIDLRGKLQGKLKLLEKGWCAVYDDAKMEYTSGVGIAGAAVMTPFRLYAHGGDSDYYSHRNIF